MAYEQEARSAWDRMAGTNAMYFICSGRDDWTPEQFFADGERFVAAEVLPRLRPGLGRERALDLGCGIGRLARPLAGRFREVIGLDISPSMIEQARTMHPDRPGLRFEVCSGAGVESVAAGSLDLFFSFIVLQHIPDREVVWSYLREAARTLRPGGQLLVQVSTEERSLGRRLSLSLRATLGAIAEGTGLRRLYSRKPREPFNWVYPIPVAELEARLRESGFAEIRMEGERTATTWVSAVKP